MGWIIVILIIVAVMVAAKLLVDWMEADPPIRKLILLLVGIGCLIFLLNHLSVVGTPIVRW